MSEDGGRHQLALDFIDDLDAETRAIHAGWENARDREKASRSRFAQHALKPEAVTAELEHVRAAIGRSEDVARFFLAVLQAAPSAKSHRTMASFSAFRPIASRIARLSFIRTDAVGRADTRVRAA